MSIYDKKNNYSAFGKNLLFFLVGVGSLWISSKRTSVEAEELKQVQEAMYAQDVQDHAAGLTIAEGNSVLSAGGNTVQVKTAPPEPEEPVKTIDVVITAYSSTPWETDDTPYVTALGTTVRDGVIANNLLPFGTQVRIPKLFGDKVFTVEDRMHRNKSNYQIDIWFPETAQAVNFGVKSALIEIIN